VGTAGGGQEVGHAFPRARRVRKRTEYLAVQGRGRRFVGTHYMLFALPRAEASAELPSSGLPSGPRFGFTVSRKVGGAVLRNKVKRWLRESCRHLQAAFPEDGDFVIVARPSAARAGYAPTASELASLARRLRPSR
jgi:ribonuclease P protein component